MKIANFFNIVSFSDELVILYAKFGKEVWASHLPHSAFSEVGWNPNIPHDK